MFFDHTNVKKVFLCKPCSLDALIQQAARKLDCIPSITSVSNALAIVDFLEAFQKNQSIAFPSMSVD